MYTPSIALATLLCVGSMGVRVAALPIGSDSLTVHARNSGIVAINSYLERLEHPHATARSILEVREDDSESPSPSAESESEPAAAAAAAPEAEANAEPAATSAGSEALTSPKSEHKPTSAHGSHRYTIASLNKFLHRVESARKARLAAKLAEREYFAFDELD